ncbi:MAG: hypothetical protein JNL68_11135 [Burkholderiales bacterium]|nr:hypothetical protein [Burkholderiales bacterium]
MIDGPVRGVLRGEGIYADKVYFFKGDQYWRYDIEKDYGEVDYPRPLSAWKLPGDFTRGIDACLAGGGALKGRAYFFRNDSYVSYEWKSERVSEPKPLAAWSKDRPFPFPAGIDAALTGRGPYDGKAYFFKGPRYARYDWKADRVDLVDQPVSAWNLGERFASDISACLDYGEGLAGRTSIAYFFKGNEYVKYDWGENRGRQGYPLLIPAGWPSGCAVWAGHSAAPTLVCDDPRLDGGKARVAYPSGSLRGQGGWQASVKFTDIKGLANQLSALRIPVYYGDDQAGKAIVPPGRITRLAMNAHGMGGSFAANGPEPGDFSGHVTDMRLLQNEELRAAFQRIRRMLAPGAPVLLMGCEVGQTLTGSNFLMALSDVLRDHPVTAFTSIGYAGGPSAKRPNESCSEAGMRDTGILHASGSQREEDQRAKYWDDLKAWPWASEFSPSAKTALNGRIIKRAESDVP